MGGDKHFKQCLFSVIIPAYNAEHTIAACLKNLSNQSIPGKDYEVIVVDDGSTDNTAEISRKFDIKYLFQQNQGPATARNKGAAEAAGEIILFTDSDCVPEYNWVWEMTEPFKNIDIDGVKGAYKTRQRSLAARFAQAEFEDRYDLLKKQSAIDMLDTYSAAVRKDVFMQMGGFDESFPDANNEDTDLSYRLTAAGHKLVFNPQAVVYHTHPDAFYKYLKIKFWRGYWRMIVYKKFPHKAVKDSYTPAVLKIQTIVMTFSFPLLILSLFISRIFPVVLFCWGIIILSSLPFCMKTYEKDKTVGLISPAIVFFRSVVFACGCLLAMTALVSFENGITILKGRF